MEGSTTVWSVQEMETAGMLTFLTPTHPETFHKFIHFVGHTRLDTQDTEWAVYILMAEQK